MKKSLIVVSAVIIAVLANISQSNKAYAGEYLPEMLLNGGFETDPVASGWSVSSGTPVGVWTGTTWHGGKRGAKLGVANSTQSVSQEVIIPAGASKATLSMWYGWSSYEYRAGYGSVTFGVYSTTDPTENYCQKALDPGINRPSRTWTWFSCDLTDVQEKKVRVQFSVTNTLNALLTTADIDDASLLLQINESTAPVMAATTSPASPDGTNGFYKIAPTITLSASDGTYGSGIASIWYKWDGGATVNYTGPFVAPEGKHTLTSWAFDNASNMSALASAFLLVDTKAPAVTASSAPAMPDGNDGYYKTQPSVTLQITDEAGGSGAGSAYYKVDGAAYAQYANVPFLIQQGAHIVTYYATDWAGNASPERTLAMNVDLTDPFLMIDQASKVASASLSPMKITGTAVDGGAGIATITANDVSAEIDAQGRFTVRVPLRNGDNTITFVATDRSGRTITFKRAVTLTQGRVLGVTVGVPVVRSIKAKTILATKLKDFNQRVVLTGENFDHATRVWIGKHEAQRVVYRSPSRLDVYIAMSTQKRGMWDVTVTNGDDQTMTAWKALRVK